MSPKAKKMCALFTQVSPRSKSCSLIKMHTRSSDTEPPGKQFWIQISCSTYYEDSMGNSHLHEACYLCPSCLPIKIFKAQQQSCRHCRIPNWLRLEQVNWVRDAVFVAHANRSSCPPSDFSGPAAGLIEAVIYNFGFSVICMSTDGRIIARNRAMDVILILLCSDRVYLW